MIIFSQQLGRDSSSIPPNCVIWKIQLLRYHRGAAVRILFLTANTHQANKAAKLEPKTNFLDFSQSLVPWSSIQNSQKKQTQSFLIPLRGAPNQLTYNKLVCFPVHQQHSWPLQPPAPYSCLTPSVLSHFRTIAELVSSSGTVRSQACSKKLWMQTEIQEILINCKEQDTFQFIVHSYCSADTEQYKQISNGA